MRSARLGRKVSSGTRSRRGRSRPVTAHNALEALRSLAAGVLAPVSTWAMRQLLGSNDPAPCIASGQMNAQAPRCFYSGCSSVTGTGIDLDGHMRQPRDSLQAAFVGGRRLGMIGDDRRDEPCMTRAELPHMQIGDAISGRFEAGA